ncbi:MULTISPECIES: hypothetical protein [Salinibaculum]|uniref:hypothetical protein n=1 Tax=Salinibaculum TaxID=2732368 RepID=UPI0030D5003D
MHVQGVVEYRDGQSWLGGTDLPHLPPDACPPVFGVPEESTGSADPTAADRGVPDGSDLLDRRYFKDAASVYGDTGPWRHAFGESWVRADELPAAVREDDRWADVLATVAEYEREYGAANVRLVVWFEN